MVDSHEKSPPSTLTSHSELASDTKKKEQEIKIKQKNTFVKKEQVKQNKSNTPFGDKILDEHGEVIEETPSALDYRVAPLLRCTARTCKLIHRLRNFCRRSTQLSEKKTNICPQMSTHIVQYIARQQPYHGLLSCNPWSLSTFRPVYPPHFTPPCLELLSRVGVSTSAAARGLPSGVFLSVILAINSCSSTKGGTVREPPVGCVVCVPSLLVLYLFRLPSQCKSRCTSKT